MKTWNIIHAVIEDHEVEDAIKSVDLSEFSADHDLQRNLRALLCYRQQIFIYLWQIVRIQRMIYLKQGVEPIWAPMGRPFRKEEERELKSMERIIDPVVLEPSTPPLTT